MTVRALLLDDGRDLPFPYLYDLAAPDPDRLRDLAEVLGVGACPEATPGYYYSGALERFVLDADGRLSYWTDDPGDPYGRDQSDVEHLASLLRERAIRRSREV